ncbi:MAG: hypothetical protein AAB614_01270 [Patescibacteria group bacterium]
MDEVLKVFGVNWHLVLIQSINFGLLLIVLNRFLYKPVMKIIDERAIKIGKCVKDADEAERKLNQAEEEKKKILSTAIQDGDEIINLSRRKAEDVKASFLKEAEDKGAKILSDVIKKAEEEKRKIIENSKSEIAKITVLAVENILREKLK